MKRPTQNRTQPAHRLQRTSILGALCLTLALTAGHEAMAAETPELLGTYRDWNAFAYDESDGKVCFVISEPKEKRLSRRANRGDVFFLITHWANRDKFGEPSVIIGYPFKEGSTPTIRIGSDQFKLKVSGDSAWVESDADEKRLVSAMKKGVSMTVVGLSSRGNKSEDLYSLRGVTAAIKKIDTTCR